MRELRRIPPTVWGPTVTLSSLWQSWMTLNQILQIEQGENILHDPNLRIGKNLASWLQDEPTAGLLSCNRERLLELTGIDIDGWMVCEAKRRVIASHPEFDGCLSFSENISRKEIIDRMIEYKQRYGGTTFHLALQVGVKPSSLNTWTHGKRVPDMDQLVKLIVTLERGFIPYASFDDTTFILMCRAIFGCDVRELFAGVCGFKDALNLLFEPYKKHTHARTASEVDIPEHALRTLVEWQPKQSNGLPPTSIERMLRALVKRFWPSLINAFDENVAEYRVLEDEGIWAVTQPLKPLIDQIVSEPTRLPEPPVESVSTLTEKTPARTEAKPIEPTPVATAVQITAQSAKMTAHDVLADILEIAVSKLRQLGVEAAESTTEVPALSHQEQIGKTIDGITHCLSRSAFTPRPNLRLTQDQLQFAGKAIDGTRALVVMLCELDPAYIRSEVRPLLGQRFYEFLIATEGLRHLLHSDAAWEMIDGMRQGAELISKVTVRTKGEE